MPPGSGDPHSGSETLWFGPPLDEAENAVILIHGRGDSARGILALAPELRSPRRPVRPDGRKPAAYDSGRVFSAISARIAEMDEIAHGRAAEQRGGRRDRMSVV
mgnify:CR=1 FL=1